MKIPLSWLAEFVDVPVEPRRLAEDLTLAGLAVDAVEGDGKDAVLDIDVTTNRVDCMNVYGVAREVSVLYDRPLRVLDVAREESGAPAAAALQVEIAAADLCPRFCARVLEVRLGPSPAWIQDRLELLGVRPINNLVDLTNYVMLEMGHPSHAFDLERVPQGRLEVRWARDGERLTTLDGVERRLGPRTGVVAGVEGPLALAGIMGGASSEVSERTRLVALEAAYWEPLAIRRAAKALAMHTEASHRFERGADPEGPPLATARIAALLLRIGAGSVRRGLIDRYVAPQPRRSAPLRAKRLRALLGVDVPRETAHRILRGLGFQVAPEAVEVPTWRGDVSREVDLIEEVARHYGLHKIPATLPPAGRVEGLRPWQQAERAVREALVGAGMTEVINYAFGPAPAEAAGGGRGVLLENPLSEEQRAMRESLVVPGLLQTLQNNLRQGRRDLAVFELGRVFAWAAEGPQEERRLGLLVAGAAGSPHWSAKPRPADFFDVKGLIELLGQRLGLAVPGFEPSERLPRFLHPGQAALVRVGDRVWGHAGALHPDVCSALELREQAFAAELSLEPVFAAKAQPVRSRPLPRWPAATRDLSIVCEQQWPAAALLDLVREAAGPLLKDVVVADRYVGSPVPPGSVSLTLSLVFQDPARTLTGDEVQASLDAVVRALKLRGAEIRGA